MWFWRNCGKGEDLRECERNDDVDGIIFFCFGKSFNFLVILEVFWMWYVGVVNILVFELLVGFISCYFYFILCFYDLWFFCGNVMYGYVVDDGVGIVG